MKLLKLTNSSISNVTARTWKNNKTNKYYYQIYHGSKGNGLWCYIMGLDNRFFKVDPDQPIIELKDDDYIILSTKTQDSKTRVDKEGNTCYIISKDNHSGYHADDIILFWEIPNKRYTDVTFNVSGEVSVLAVGYAGKERNGVMYKSPLPILEIYGNFEFSWTGINNSNETISQSGKYSYYEKEWKINNIKIGE